MKTAIRKMGNSQGVLIPKPFLLQTGLDIGEVEIEVEDDTIVIRKPKKKSREGWAKACQKIAAGNAEQVIAWPLITNEQDAGFTW
ncbi:AbrB/MazE/SpoVT family DNA-binding domain-containing protein [Herbaspirillum sp. GCM10030257]|uniref:AbrB/MazE/SpoVT family DNA-binding domain-containing protein n=1 Tax=Herbaspirillum sp. GCM10030257 TaxID=3273393 RepID=UPI00361FAA9F